MEILFLLLLFAAANSENKAALARLRPIADFLESGDLKKLSESEQFRRMRIGNAEGKDLLSALETIQLIARNAEELKSLADGKTPDLHKLAELFPTGGTQGLGMLANLFGTANRSESRSSRQDSAVSLAPVANIADKEIVYALNRYFS